MPGLRQVIRGFTAPLRFVGDSAARAADNIRSQAPGARMIGEFAVKMGLSEIGKRINPKDPDRE